MDNDVSPLLFRLVVQFYIYKPLMIHRIVPNIYGLVTGCIIGLNIKQAKSFFTESIIQTFSQREKDGIVRKSIIRQRVVELVLHDGHHDICVYMHILEHLGHGVKELRNSPAVL